MPNKYSKNDKNRPGDTVPFTAKYEILSPQGSHTGATVKCCVRDQFIRRQFLHSLNHFYLLHVCHSQI